MRASRTKTISVSLPVAILILIQALGLFPSSAAAQCPTMSAEGSTFGTTNFNPVRAQMWYNDGLWWGAFSDNDNGIYFYNFPNNAATRGPIIDGNIAGRPDVLWDGTNLFVAVWKSVSLATLYKYTYNSATKTHSLISGFPVNLALSDNASQAIVLEKDSTGKLWATYTGTQGNNSDGKVHVIWSTSADHKLWNTVGTDLATGLGFNNSEISAIVRFGGNKIGIAWSNQPAKEIGFRYHIDGQAETTWSAKELIDSGLGPRGLGGVADDHLSMKTSSDGRIFVVAKDSDNDGAPEHLIEGRLHLYIRNTAGVWGQKTNIQPDFSQLPTRPVLLLDEQNDRAYVLYSDASPSGAQRTFITYASMTNPSPFSSACVFTTQATSNPTSTKQNVSTSTGIMAAASTSAFGGGDVVFRSLTLQPVSTIHTLSPTSAPINGLPFTLTVNGNGFVPGESGSFVRWNGPGGERATTFVSSTQITAQILAQDLFVAGTIPVSVWNAGTGEVTNTLPFTVTIPNNPVPTLSSISSTTKTAGDPAFVMTLTGTNFINGSVVRFSGGDRATTFVSATALTAQITLADLATAGTFPITVFNPLPGGGTSNAINLIVNSPPGPTLSSISPTTKLAGEAGFTLTANGTNFVSGSIVRFNGNDRTTTFQSSTQLTAQITAADILAAGTLPITVFNPAPGGGTSSAINLTVNNLLPTLSSISPTTKFAGEPAFVLTVNGSNFINGSVVRFNGSGRTTTFVSSTQLTAQITAADIQAQGTGTITVFNPTPGGGASNGASLTIAINPSPSINGLSPSSANAQGAAFALTVNGSNFIGSSEVRWNGQARTTGFVSGTQLTAQISAADILAQGTASITVVNPAPGGGTSNSATFTINASTPIGFEADVAPRPNGSNTGVISISDWVQAGRFASGLDTVNLGSEFQRLDCAPRTTLGGGTITISDWVQAGRYASGLDPVTPVGGPTGPPSGLPPQTGVRTSAEQIETDRVVRVVGATMSAGQSGTVSIELDSQGNENALGFSLNFDPTKLTYVSWALGTHAAGASPQVNANGSANGKVGIALALGAGATFSAGPRQLMVLTFNVSPSASGSTNITFGDVPIGREVVSPAPAELPAMYELGTVTITDPPSGTPELSSISPGFATAGGPDFLLTVNGSSFDGGSVVQWNGANRATSVVNSTQVTAQITAADVQTAGTATVAVFNPAPGGVSNLKVFTIENPSPSLSALSPMSVSAGGPGFNLSVTGSDFVSGSVVSWNGIGLTTSFDSSTQLTAEIPAAYILTPGTFAVTVVNPAPGGGSSPLLSFTVNNPTPSVSGPLSPSGATAGGAGFTLSVRGSNFIAGSVVKWNGSDRPTSFLNSTEVFAEISAVDIQTAGTAAVTVFNPAPGGGESIAVNFVIDNLPDPATVKFSSANYELAEALNSIEITVVRTGDMSGTVTVDFATDDSGVFDIPCVDATGGADQRCDYATRGGTLSFAPGEASKSFTLLNTDDAYFEGNETFTLTLKNPALVSGNVGTNSVGATLGTPSKATLMILDNDLAPPTSNPINGAEYFVNQHYMDFMSRTPDPGGLAYWSNEIAACGTNAACINSRRVAVSAAFFVEREFQQTGSVVYRLYKAAYGQRPAYPKFMPDRSQLVDGQDLPASTLAFANRFVARPEFQAAYPNSTPDDFVNHLFDTAAVNNSAARAEAISALTTGSKNRAQVLLDLIELQEFKQREYNPSFVLMQYFGYLRRDPDEGGYLFWLDVVNNRATNNYQAMVCAFITSEEYQKRFSSVGTANNTQCGP